MNRIRNLDEIARDAAAIREQLAKDMHIEDDCIVFDCVHGVHIEKSAISDPNSFLGWTYHLATKPWMTPQRLRYFMELASSLNGIEIRRPM